MNLTSDTLSTLETALRSGGKLHAFRSGGGLRVVRIEGFKTGGRRSLIAYGEHPNIEEALDMTARDYIAGQKVYNPHPPDPYFLTGSSSPSSDLDAWVLKGSTFDADYNAAEGLFRVTLEGYCSLETPPEHDAAAKAGQTVRWTDRRGVVLVTRPYTFSNGERGSNTSIESTPEGLCHHDVWVWEAFRLGQGRTLTEAIDAALVATGEPIARKTKKSP